MKKIITAVRDELVGHFANPAVVETEKSAIASYLFTIKNEPYMAANAEQYSLWTLGIYDDETGAIHTTEINEENIETPIMHCLINGLQTKKGVEENAEKG